MRAFTVLLVLSVVCSLACGSTIIVDQNAGAIRTIQAGITAAVSGDTVKVWPGEYREQVSLNKNITLMGSGYENTTLTSSADPSVTMNSGKIMWFKISSTGGNGIVLSGGTVTNCVIVGCAGNGILMSTGTAVVTNCVVLQNVGNGIGITGGTISVSNCISRQNGKYGFHMYFAGTFNLSFCNGSRYYFSATSPGCIDQEPLFAGATDYHLSETSPCWNTGNTSLTDPDGSQSDMGYFGGPDCPIYPTVFEITLSPNGNTVNLTAKARANY
jgi:hypothetical protein